MSTVFLDRLTPAAETIHRETDLPWPACYDLARKVLAAVGVPQHQEKPTGVAS